ncbi:MAG TPA: DUF2723 domain-containing protein [Candidatus Limnocylindria bacterium]|nr:DUF2723 domain-containing protein [Candidatus Limnocylindria bacterium]
MGCLALAAYVRTLLPGIAFGDWGEMQTVPHVLGVAHPTGYPTYILLAWLAELVPVGSIAFRANLFSAACVAAAVAATTLIALRLGARPLIAMAAGLALGATGTVWAAATVAEVNPLHLLMAALIIHRALVWAERRSPVDLTIGGLLVGLALGNHLLTLFIAPFVALFVLWSGRREIASRPAILALPVGALLLGLAVYLYIPLAASQSPPLPYNHPVTLDGVLWLVSGTQFRGQFDFLSARGPGEFVASLPDLWELLTARATPVLPVLGLAGLVILVVRRPAFGLMCLGVAFSAVYIWANYLHLEHYLLVPLLVLAIGASVALESAARAVAWLFARSTPRRAATATATGAGGGADATAGAMTMATAAGLAIGAAAIGGALVLAAGNWDRADRSGDRSGQEYVDAVFAALPPNAAILSYWDASTPLWHGQLVEGRRSDVLIVDDTNIVYEGWVTRERRISSLICERPVFILRLGDADLVPTEQAFRLTPLITVRVAAGEPTAAWTRDIYRVEQQSPGGC